MCCGRQSVKLPSVLVLHLVCNGAGPTALIQTQRDPDADAKSLNEFHELSRMHAAFLECNQCFVVAMGEDTEVFLVPVKTQGALSDGCVFWAYAAMRGAVAHVTEMVDTGRIPLIFDLDETLVLAHTIYSLKTRSAQLVGEIAELQKEITPAAESKEKLKKLQIEEAVLNEDISQLTSFMERDRIEVNGETIYASPECVSGDEGHDFLRPVVRLPGKIFTRIDPKRNDTSMVIRIRDEWSDLSAYLRGEGTAEKRQRFKIWVCTAAERGYALEAWRLLDPEAELIPKEEVKKRLICAGKQKKSLFRTFCLGPLHEQPYPRDSLCPKKKLGPLCEGHSEMAMAVIADDRIDVWEKRNQDQIMQIAPFQYPCIETQSPSEIQRMQSVFQSVRSQFYYELMEQISPNVREMWNMGFEDEEAVQRLQETLKRAASIAPFLSTFAQPVETPVVPETPVLPEASLKPNDRRQIKESRVNRTENGRVSRLPMIVKKRRNAKKPKRLQNNTLPPSPDDGRMSLDIQSTPESEKMQTEPMKPEILNTPTMQSTINRFVQSVAQRSVIGEATQPFKSKMIDADEDMEDVQMSHEALHQEIPVMTEINHISSPYEMHAPLPDPGSLIPGLSHSVGSHAIHVTEAPFGMTSILAASQQLEALSVQAFPFVPQNQLPSLLTQNQPETSPPMTQFVAMPPVQDSASSTSTSSQLRLIPGKVVLVPPTQTQGDPSQSRYTIVELSDGQLILQPVPPAPPKEPQPASVTVQNVQAQPMQYLLQKNAVVNSPPVMQLKQWNENWTQHHMHSPVNTQQISGWNSTTPTGGTTGDAHAGWESSAAGETYTDISHGAAIAKARAGQRLEYASLPSSEPQQLFYPMATPPPPPPPPPPPTQSQTPPPPAIQNFSEVTPTRTNRGKLRRGFHQRGVGKRVKSVGGSLEPRPQTRFSPVVRGKRGQANNRRSVQRKPQNAKNKNILSLKKQKQLTAASPDATQDFNLVGYMAQLEDELEEPEAIEEGEIRE